MLKKLIAMGVMLGGVSGAWAAPIQWSGNGHWYEYFSTPVTGPEAFTKAASLTFSGMQGYLATVTSAGENAFVANDVAGGAIAWLGGSDNGAAVNDWTWRVGPEAGQAFTYTNWNGGEPNNVNGGEDYLQINWATNQGWNDHGGPGGNFGQANGYVVEFSPTAAVPEPAGVALALAGLVVVGAAARRIRRD